MAKRWGIRAALFLGLLFGVGLVGIVVLQIDAIGGRVVRMALERAAPVSQASVERVGGTWLGGLDLEGVRLRIDDRGTVEASSLRVRWSLLPLLWKTVAIQRLEIASPRVQWDACAPAPATDSTEESSPSAWRVLIESAALGDGEISGRSCAGSEPEPFGAWGLTVAVAGAELGERQRAESVSLSGRLRPPGTDEDYRAELVLGATLTDLLLGIDTLSVRSPRSDVRGSGAVVLGTAATDSSELRLRLDPLDFGDLQPYVGSRLVTEGVASGSLTVIRSSAGTSVVGAVAVDEGGSADYDISWSAPDADSLLYRATLTARDFDPARLLAAGPTASLDGRVEVSLDGQELESANGRIALDVRDAEASGSTRSGRLTVDLRNGSGDVNAEGSWAGWIVRLRGSARPFAELPSYDLTADFDAPRPAALIRGGAADALRGRLQLVGAGVQFADAGFEARLDLEPFAVGRETVGPLQVDARVDSSRVVGTLEGPVAGGRVAGRTRIRLGNDAGFLIEELRLDGVDVAALLADSLSSEIGLVVQGEGSGFGFAELTGQMRVRSEGLTYGPYQVDSATARVDLRAAGVTATVRVASNEGEVDATVVGDPRAARPSFRITSGTLSRIDVGALLGSDGWSTDLNGTFEGRVTTAEPLSQAVASGRVELTPSRVGSQGMDGATLTVALDRGRARLDAGLRFPDGALTISGRGSPFDSIVSLEVDSLAARNVDLAALSASVAWPTSLDGVLRLQATGRDAASLDGTLDLIVHRAVVSGTRLSSSTLTGRARGGVAQMDARVSGPWGTAQATAQAGITTASQDFTGSGEFDVTRLAELLGEGERSGRLRGGFELSGNGRVLDSIDARGRVTMGPGEVADVPFDSLLVVANVNAGAVRFDSTSVWSSAGVLELEGTVPATATSAGRADLRMLVTTGDLSPIAGAVGLERLVAEGGTLDATLMGPRDDLTLNASFAATQLYAGPFAADRVAGTFTAGGNPDAGVGDWTSSVRLRVAQVGGVRLDSTDVELAYGDQEVRVSFESLVDQRRHVRLAGRFDPVGRRGVLEELDLAVDDDRWTLRSEAAVTLGAAPRVDEIVLSAGDQRLEIRGGVDPSGDQDLTVSLESFRLESIADLVGWGSVGGTVDGSLEMTGPAAGTVARMSVSADLTEAGTALGVVRAEATADDGRLTVDASAAQPTGAQVLTLRGSVPFTLTLPDSAGAGGAMDLPDGPIDVTVRADSFDLEWLAPFVESPDVTSPTGILVADLRAAGTAQSPEMSGDLLLESVGMALPELGLELSEGNFTGVLEGDRIRVDALRLRSGEGTVSGSGTITFDRLLAPELDLTARLDEFEAIHNRLAEVTLTGDLTLTGAPLAPEVAGTLDLLRSEVNLDAEFATADVNRVELTEEDMRMVESMFGVVVGTEVLQTGLYEASDLKLSLTLGRDSWARQRSNPEMAIAFSGDLTLEKRPAAPPEVTGTLLAIPARSYISQFGRRFQVASGEVVFSGPLTQARVDLTATYDVPSRDNPDAPEVVISLTAEGTADTLSLALASEPSMENADIISYIATGRPASQGFTGAGGGQGTLVGTTAAIARDQLVGLLQRAAMDVGGFEVVEIRSDGAQGTTLVAGRFLSPRLYLGLMQPIFSGGADQARSSEERARAIEIEYEAYRWLILNLQRGGSRLGFFLRSRFVY